MNFLIYALVLVAFIIALGYLYVYLSTLKNMKWFEKPSSEGNYVDSSGMRLFYREKGKSGATVVVINTIGSSQAEWWSIQNEIGLTNRMITWDRTGYGRSSSAQESDTTKQDQAVQQKNTAEKTAEELNLLLKFKRIRKPIILVANHTSILLAIYYAKAYPKKVAGLILINPFPLRYSEFISSIKKIDECPDPIEIITKDQIKGSRGLFRMLSPYRGYKLDKRYIKPIIEDYSKIENYNTLKAEISTINETLDKINEAGPLPQIPIKVLYPASERLIRDFVRYGINEYSARQLERVYQKHYTDIMSITPETEAQEVTGGGAYIHISKPKVIIQEINKMINDSKKSL